MTLPSQPGDPRREPAPLPFQAGGRYRFARWDGSQRLPDLTAEDVLDALRDDVMAHGNLGEAMRRLFQRGVGPRTGGPEERLAGLRDLMDRLTQRRREALKRYQLEDVLGEIRAELDAIVQTERAGIQRRVAQAAASDPESPGAEPTDALNRMLREMAAKREAQLNELPADPGGRIRELQDYDFMDQGARARFEALTERLRSKVLDNWFQGLSRQIQEASPEQLAANREMVRDLNRLLEERLDGGDPDATEFLAKHGDFFPGARTLDDIIGQLAERMAAMQSLLASMSSQQRQELQSMMDALLRDDRLRWDLAQLAGNLDQILPEGLGQRMPFRGDEPLSLDAALDELGRLEAMDRLSARLGAVDDPAALAEVDADEVRQLLDDDSARELEALQRLSRLLEEAGYVERQGDRIELTPRGSRRIGQGVLDELFARLRRDAFGGHALDRSGSGGERTEPSVPYEFGRPFDLDLPRTMANALARGKSDAMDRGAGPPGRVQLSPADFEVYGTEQLSQVSTVLLLDMSRSMLLRGCFLAAKKVAVALDSLIRTQYPRDELHVIGFAYYAREIRPGSLAGLSWQGYEYGTNLQHGLMLARQILARSHSANREVVVITDGEPTAHFEAGQVEFSYPPTRRTVQETLREVARCTRDGITINTFMLERSRALTEFVERMTRLNRGRAFFATPERLGEYILVDYVGRRTSRP